MDLEDLGDNLYMKDFDTLLTEINSLEKKIEGKEYLENLTFDQRK